MNRQEWHAFHHSIRHDARAYRERHGGYPCLNRSFTHNGEEWSFTRARNDGIRWTSYLRKSLAQQRSWRELHASELHELPHWRWLLRRDPWKRSTCLGRMRTSLRIAREWRAIAASRGAR